MTESSRQNVTKFHRVQTWEKLGHSLLFLRSVFHSSSFRMIRMFLVTSRCDILNHWPLPAATLRSWLWCDWSALPQHLACLSNGIRSAVVPFFSIGLKRSYTLPAVILCFYFCWFKENESHGGADSLVWVRSRATLGTEAWRGISQLSLGWISWVPADL